MSMDRKNTHGPAGKALWPLLSTGLSALAAEYCLMILLQFLVFVPAQMECLILP